MISEKIRNPLSLFDVRDKVAIITGASGSFGHACAVALGALGAKLLLASGTAEELEAVVNDVRDVGGKVASIVRRPDTLEDAEAILTAALDAYGRVDQLVVASGTNKAGFIESQSYEDWQRVMDANVRGPWLMAKAVGTYWIKQGIKGKVLLMSSTRGRHGNLSGYTAYCSSKGATDALTRVLATEWAKYGTTVNGCGRTTTSAMRRAPAPCRASRSGGSARRRTSSAWRSICSRRHRISAPARSCMSTAASPPVSACPGKVDTGFPIRTCAN
jgi:NAD(P)-dependent dehydrogenase (short-subunit alcohol dehydrogenase family)